MRLALLALVVSCAPASTMDAGVTESGPTTFAVSGLVVDGTNAPWASAKLQVCNEALCTLGSADQSGAFHIAVPPGTNYHVIAHAPATETRDTSAGIGVVGDVTSDVTLTTPIAIS